MNTDFLDAHSRHWEDAERLFSEARWANADHLYGMSAECGIKKLMIAFGMPHQFEHPTKRDDRVHVNDLWDRYEIYRSGHHIGVHYGLPDEFEFIAWRVEQRYANQSCFDQESVDVHRQGAQAVRALIHKAKMDGVME